MGSWLSIIDLPEENPFTPASRKFPIPSFNMRLSKLLLPSCLIVLGGFALQGARADSIVPDGDFESGTGSWKIWVPDESKDQNCRFDVATDNPHSGAACARLQSDDFARFAISPGSFPAQAGEHYRLSAWVRADSAAEIRPNSPGFVIRVMLHPASADAAPAFLFIGPGNRVKLGNPANPTWKHLTEWTQIEAVIEIPPGVDAIAPSLFDWWAKGALFADDFSIEKVDASTPATALVQPPPAAPEPTPAAAVPEPAVSDSDLLALLNLDLPGLEKVKAAATASGDGGQIDWKALESAYLDYRRTASPARWNVMPQDKPAHPTKKDDPRGDEVLAHHIRNGYGFQPAEADMGKDFDWTFNPVPRSNPAYTEEWTNCAISRCEFWEALASAYWQTGDEKYAAGWVDQLQDFAAKNPLHFDTVKGVPNLWRSLDSAERISISWPDAYFHFLQSPSFTPEANWLYLRLNYEHAKLLMHVLADPTRTGNWVVTECAGLYTIGTLFPEFRDAAAWRQQAIDRLTVELTRMVPPDGFEAELTPTYHYVALDGFRKPFLLAKLNDLTVPENFQSAILAMYRAPVLVMDQSGHDVPTNDSVPVSAALKAGEGLKIAYDPLLAWAASHGQKGDAPPVSDALPYAGFYAMRSGWKRDDLFLFFRAGPTGILHQHEDMLEVVLRAWNKTLLFDPGTYVYDSSDWRRFTLGTASHSTIIVDGKWQHRGPNKPPVTQPTGNPWVTSPLFDYVAGTYDGGYQESDYRPRPFDPQLWKGTPDKSVTHTRRVLFLRPYYALVLDTLDGTGNHVFDAHFQLDAPAAHLDPTTHAAFSDNPADSAQLALYPLDTDNLAVDIVQGQKEPLLGWMPEEHRPIPTIRFRKQQDAPAIFATFLYPYRGTAPDFAATPLAASGGDLWSSTFKTAQETAEVVLAKNGTPATLALKSGLLGNATAQATGLVIRQPNGTQDNYVGGIDLSLYQDGQTDLSLDKPAPLIFSHQKDGLLCFNAGDAPVTLAVKRPFAATVTLPPKAWSTVTASGVASAAAPTPFQTADASSSVPAYNDYLNSVPAAPAITGDPIRVPSETMTLPQGASLTVKTGADGKVIARWEAAGTMATAHVDVPQAGWYHLKLRYCSGESPTRSILINGKIPFGEAEGFSLPSTMGNPPSDGWSNFSDDWIETVLGSEQAAPGWKIYLDKGPCQIDLRNDGGGMNLDWLELDPS